MNELLVIKPYKYEDMWVFDDDNTGLVREPFVGGADTIISEALRRKKIKGDKGFLLTFSASAFPGFDYAFRRLDKEALTGVWYFSNDFQMEGWLCSALFKYFRTAPETLYTRFAPLPKGGWLKKMLAKG